MRRFLLGGDGGASALADLGLLALRVSTGLGLALAHGRGKVPPSPRFVERVAEMGFPLPNLFAWGAGLVELAGGLLIVVGLFTRPAATAALVLMIAVFFMAHAGDPFAQAEKSFVYGAVMLALALIGAGRYSVDGAIGRRRGGYVERFRRR